MLAGVVATVAQWCAPWQKLYSNSKPLETGVTAVHIVATLVGGGIAIAADRHTLRRLRHGRRLDGEAFAEMQQTHRPVLVGLAVLFVSGVALAAADVETFAKSPLFLIKLACVLLLCVNGLFLIRAENQLGQSLRTADSSGPALTNRLRTASWLSILLWISTTVAGAALVNA